MRAEVGGKESVKGRFTYWWFPSINKGLANKHLRLDSCVTQYLTGHGYFAKSLRRFRLRNDGGCHCEGVQTAYHVIVECPLLEDLRVEWTEVYNFDAKGVSLTT